MVSALFASTLLGQRASAEQPPTQIFPSTPVFQATTGTAPTFQIHGVTVQLGINESKVETLTLWRNGSDQPVEGKILFVAKSNGLAFSDLRRLTSTWNKQPVNFRVESVEKLAGYSGDGRIMHTQRIHAAIPVSLPAKGTGALRMEFIQPNAKVGYTKDARQWTYAMPELTNVPEQFRLALKYDSKVVWRPIEGITPFGKWQIGNNGAYLKLDGLRQPGGTAFYRFYPKSD